MNKLLINEIKNQRNRVKMLNEIYESEVSSLNQMINSLEVEISIKLEDVFGEILPVNVYGSDEIPLWFEIDVLGFILDEEQIAMIEEITKTTMDPEYSFIFKKNE